MPSMSFFLFFLALRPKVVKIIPYSSTQVRIATNGEYTILCFCVFLMLPTNISMFSFFLEIVVKHSET